MAERRFYQGETFANYDPGELLENAEFEDCVPLTTAIFPAWCSALPP